jgi:DNA polymerase III subunit epsilon
MTETDQLGLFGYSQPDLSEGSRGKSKLSVTIEFNNFRSHPVDDVIKRIRKNILELDATANVFAQVEPSDQPWEQMGFFAIDVETTGLDAASNRVIELAIVPFNMPDDVKPFSQLFCVGETLSQEIVQITGISDAMLSGQPSFNESADYCLNLLKRASFVVAYNAKFDRPFLESEMARIGKVLPDVPWIDPFIFICELDRYKRGKKLSDAARRWGVNLENAHRAQADAEAAGQLLLKMAAKLDCYSLSDLLAKQKLWQWHNAHNMAELKRSTTWSINR